MRARLSRRTVYLLPVLVFVVALGYEWPSL